MRFSWVTKTEEVEVTGGAMGLAGPDSEQRSAFEHEAHRVLRSREPEEQPLVRIAREHELKILVPLVSQPQQSSTH